MEIVGSIGTLGLSPWWFAAALAMALVIGDILRSEVKVVPKPVWIAATILLFPLGPLLYLLWGRVGRPAEG